MVQRMGDADEQCSAIVQCWLQDRSDAKATASSLTCELQDKMGCWPPAAGLGVTLLKAGGEVGRVACSLCHLFPDPVMPLTFSGDDSYRMCGCQI